MTRGVLGLSLIVLMCACVVAEAVAQPARRPHRLLPVPASVTVGDGGVPVTREFRVALTGGGAGDRRLLGALDRFLVRLQERTGLEFPRPATGEATTAALVVEVGAAGGALPALGDDESYAIEVDGRQARLRAPLVVGAMHGFETLLQWLDGGSGGYTLPAGQITDRPRFPWRGLLIDVCRHWMPVEVVKRNLDGMAAVKLNVLHFHLTEDQGFRIESRAFPKLHQLGSDGQYYTQAQVKEIVAYAADRGIRVVPEFDMPGHVTSWLVGHPELGSAPGPYQIGRTWGVYDPVFDPTKESLYAFLDKFFADVVALFPDPYLHIGGDENNGKHWNANPAITAFMKQKGFADQHALQAYFNQRVSRLLTKHGKRLVGWDEVLHPDLPKDIVVQSWRGPKSLVDAAKQGYQVILSNGYYLDYLWPAARHYSVDPVPADSPLSPEEAARVLGGEACMWAEVVDAGTIDSRIWPRLAAIAERYWSPREVRDVDDLWRRLAPLSARLEEHGLEHASQAERLARHLVVDPAQAPAVVALLGVVQPVQVGQRHRQYREAHGSPLTQFTPLTGLADAAAPDPTEARQVAADVAALVADAPLHERRRASLQARFAAWRDLAVTLSRVTDASPILHDARPLAAALDSAAAVGLEALARLGAGGADAAWKAAALDRLTHAAAPRAYVELAVVPALRDLVEAAAR